MCGICGIVKFDDIPVEKAPLKTMMQKQKHRGPNDEGTFLHQSMGFGFVRLSILDLSSAGHQPMQNADQRYTIVFNGEIYNYIELREELKGLGIEFFTQTDTEVLLKMYIQYGRNCLNKLNGMFAFAVHDKENNELFIARDRFGVKPLYYYKDGRQFIFASEIPPILAVYGKKNEVNDQQLFDYLAFNRTDHTEDTFFRGIKKLQHGHCLRIKGNNVVVERWYDVSKQLKKESADNEQYKKLIIDAVKLRMRSDVPVGVCLSGGLDSSAITSIIAQELHNPEVHTFSAVYTPGESADESKFINLYKDTLSNMHSVTPTAEMLLHDISHFVRTHAEPIPSTSPYAQYCVMRLAQKDVTVTLDGQGADEALGGYHYFFGFYFKDLLKKCKLITLAKELIAYTRVHKSLYGIKTFFYFLLPGSLKTRIRVNEKGFINEKFVSDVVKQKKSVIANDLYASKTLQASLINHFEYKLEHLLKWSDRNSMAFSVESRTPFLDYRLIEYTLCAEADAIIKNGYTKSILRESLKGILPEEIRLRKDKVGFATPQDKWFRTDEFKGLISDILTSESFAERHIIDVPKAQELYKRHLSGEINISKDIWKWIHLELWFREFIDQ